MDKSVGAVVYRQNNSKIEFLLIRSARDGFWGVPKGHPENSETEIETATREILEETSSIVKFIAGYRETINYILPKGEPKEVVFYLARFERKRTDLSYDPAEIATIGWYDFASAIERMTYENSKLILNKAYEFIKEIPLKPPFTHVDEKVKL